MVPKRLARLDSHRVDGGLRIYVARGPRARMPGLALLGEPPEGSALLIPSCRSVHTFGMRFAIDLVFLDRRGRVLRISRGIPAWRVVRCRDAESVLETPMSEARRFVRAGAARVAAELAGHTAPDS